MSYKSIHATSMEKFPAYRETIPHELTSMAEDHNGGSDSFTPYPYDSGYEIHKITCIGTSGKNTDAAGLESIAKAMYPNGYEKLLDTFQKDKALLDEIEKTFEEGDSLTMLTDHSSVMALPFGGGALVHALFTSGKIGPEDIDVLTVANAMIKHVKVLGVIPAAETLADVFSETRYTLPSSESVLGAKIPKLARKAYNQASVESINLLLADDKPTLVLLAGSGQRDRVTKRTFGVKRTKPGMHMRPPADGTLDIVKQTHILEASIDVRDSKPKIHIGPIVPPAVGSADLHRSMKRIATGASMVSKPSRYYYETREEYNKAIGNV